MDEARLNGGTLPFCGRPSFCSAYRRVPATVSATGPLVPICAASRCHEVTFSSRAREGASGTLYFTAWRGEMRRRGQGHGGPRPAVSTSRGNISTISRPLALEAKSSCAAWGGSGRLAFATTTERAAATVSATNSRRRDFRRV